MIRHVILSGGCSENVLCGAKAKLLYSGYYFINQDCRNTINIDRKLFVDLIGSMKFPDELCSYSPISLPKLFDLPSGTAVHGDIFRNYVLGNY